MRAISISAQRPQNRLRLSVSPRCKKWSYLCTGKLVYNYILSYRLRTRRSDAGRISHIGTILEELEATRKHLRGAVPKSSLQSVFLSAHAAKLKNLRHDLGGYINDLRVEFDNGQHVNGWANSRGVAPSGYLSRKSSTFVELVTNGKDRGLEHGLEDEAFLAIERLS